MYVFLKIIFLLLLLKRLTYASNKFKTCNENLFCKRYKKYVGYLNHKYKSKDDNETIWSIDDNSILFFENCNELKYNENCSTISFNLHNTYYREIPPLKCVVFIYSIGIFRIQIDETRPYSGFQRYRVGRDVIFGNSGINNYLINGNNYDIVIDEVNGSSYHENAGNKNNNLNFKEEIGKFEGDFMKNNSNYYTKVTKYNDKVIFVIPKLENINSSYNDDTDKCESKIEIYYKPFGIKSYYCNNKIASINGNKLFNFERSGRVYNLTNKINKHNISMRNLYSDSFNSIIDDKLNSDTYSGHFNYHLKDLIIYYIRKLKNIFKYIFMYHINNNLYANIDVKNVIDAADIYPRGLWAEIYDRFVDFKYNGPTSVGLDIQIYNSKDVYGFSEKACPLNLKDFEEPYRFYNVDSYKYKLNTTDPMYGSIPLLISLSDVSNNNINYLNKTKTNSEVIYSSIMWLNPSDTYVKLYKKNDSNNIKYIDSWWVSETGIIDLSIFVSNDIERHYYLLNMITGFPLFAPRFSFGFHYSKWEETNESRILEIDRFLTSNNIPFDSIWLDIEYTKNKSYLVVDESKFPNINNLIDILGKKDKYLIFISDPHISVEGKYIYSFFEKLKYCHHKYIKYKLNYKNIIYYYFKNRTFNFKYINIKNCDKYKSINNIHNTRLTTVSIQSPWIQVPNLTPIKDGENDYSPNNDFVGVCWPGKSKYLDLFSPIVQNYYSNYYKKLFNNYTNIGYWLDMNEPTVFNLPELTLPKQTIYNYYNLEEREIHSLYSFYNVRSVFNGLLNKFKIKRRPFILSRSFWFGSNRYSFVWTGDSESNWNHYYSTININVKNAICGFSLTGSDIGGYEGNPEKKLYIRWHQLGIWFPFYREHSSINSLNREFLFDDNLLSGIISKYVNLRYKLIPYWYTLSAYYSFFGIPIIKPLFWLNPTNSKLRSIENSFIVGDSFMINILLKSGYTTINIYSFIANFKYINHYFSYNNNIYNIWYDFHSENVFIDNYKQLFNNEVLDSTPDLVKGGSIIPISHNKFTNSSYSSNAQLDNPFGIKVYLSGKVFTSYLFRYFITKNSNNNDLYNNYIIDPITLHSEGSIYLDDGITYSYLNRNEYIFDDIVFKVNFTNRNSNGGDKYNCDNIYSLFKYDNILSSLDLKLQSELFNYFRSNFEYNIFLKPKKINSIHSYNIKNININDNTNNINSDNYYNGSEVLKINKNIEYIKVIGFFTKPREIYAVIKGQRLTLKYELKMIDFNYKSNYIGKLYSIKIYIDQQLINFGNYNWVIKIFI
ncbi:hypothetical protein FG379_001757 [Cryptosporidium bovis]|uniref:uncharacterized protein n=1 Tax=Cryptosporidium bovis TaxID=310047 RepID=UPI00351A9EEE|nr:hypothetical protein FG379_001757 [Cryptosporidium bovis]